MSPWYRDGVGRLLLAVWLACFSCQSADLFAIVAPDDCSLTDADSPASDSCPDGCVRCVCCARASLTATPVPAPLPTVDAPADTPLPPCAALGAAHTLGVFHVPKSL